MKVLELFKDIKTLQAKIDWLLQYYYGSRGVGHTTVMFDGVRTAKEVYILASTYKQAKILSKHCDNALPIHWNKQLHGQRTPIAIDNSAMIDILGEVYNILERIKQ